MTSKQKLVIGGIVAIVVGVVLYKRHMATQEKAQVTITKQTELTAAAQPVSDTAPAATPIIGDTMIGNIPAIPGAGTADTL